MPAPPFLRWIERDAADGAALTAVEEAAGGGATNAGVSADGGGGLAGAVSRARICSSDGASFEIMYAQYTMQPANNRYPPNQIYDWSFKKVNGSMTAG